MGKTWKKNERFWIDVGTTIHECDISYYDISTAVTVLYFKYFISMKNY